MKNKNRTAPPVAIMIHVPENFFSHGYQDVMGHKARPRDPKYLERYKAYTDQREAMFRGIYDTMGTEHCEEHCFYHFISSCPSANVADHIQHIYVCFRGKVQYKAILVKFMRNEIVDLPTYQYLEPRDWCVTTGPVVKPPHDILLKDVWKGARQGFRYLEEELF